MKVTSAIVFLATLAPAHAYLQQMTPTVKKSFAPGQGVKHAPVAGNGMGGFAPGTLAAPPAPVAAEVVAAHAAPTSAFVKPSSYAPGQGKKHAPVAGTGLGGFAPGSPAPIDGMAPIGIAAPNSADYMAQMGGGFASAKKSSYGPGSHYAPSGGTAGAAQAAHVDGNYMDRMGGGSAPVKEATYGLGNGKIYSSTGGTGIGYSHLESFGVPTSAYEQKSTFVPTHAGEPNSNNAVLSAISQMNNDMITHQQATIEVLKDISAGVKRLVSKTAASSSWQ